MKNTKRCLPLFLFAFLFLNAFCWEKEGHNITGVIAVNYLGQGTKDSMEKYLGAMTLQEAATWWESVRSDPSYEYLKQFHYINIEKGKNYDPASENNIISELNKVMGEIKNRNNYPKAQIALDLKLLCSLIGDLHMPLHVGYAVDRGGNNVAVNFLGRPSNLHRVWAVDIIEQYSIAAVDCQKTLATYSPDELKKLRTINIIAWMNESRAYLPTVYDFTNPDINAAYCQKNKPIIEKQLALAGLRLAQVLNDLFSQ
jgi:hypothetical protein